MYQDNEHFEALNCFKEAENLDTLDKAELVRRFDKSFDIKLEKVRKILKKDQVAYRWFISFPPRFCCT
jgi:hypothetical protein